MSRCRSNLILPLTVLTAATLIGCKPPILLKRNARRPTTSPPPTTENVKNPYILTPEEREAIGLSVAPGGPEKIKSEVYRAIEESRKKPEAFSWPDAVCVQVLLRHGPQGEASPSPGDGASQSDSANSPDDKASIAQLQQRVLRRLTAGEFAMQHQFMASPGLLGYATQEGLARLAEDPNVLAVGLEDQRQVIPTSPLVNEEDVVSPPIEPQKAHPRVHWAVFNALHEHGRVRVVVTLKGDPGKPAEVAKAMSRVLSAVTADEFHPTNWRPVYLLFHGDATRSAVEKLEKHADVYVIRLPERSNVKPCVSGDIMRRVASTR